MDKGSPPTDEYVKIMAAIGYICVQWARFETLLLGIIATAQELPIKKTFLMFGGLDMLPRLNMTISMVEEARLPSHFSKRLRAARKALQDGGLLNRRNQAVHGAHAESEMPESIKLMMVRWREPKREQDISLSELVRTGDEIALLANDAWKMIEDYATLKFGDDFLAEF